VAVTVLLPVPSSVLNVIFSGGTIQYNIRYGRGEFNFDWKAAIVDNLIYHASLLLSPRGQSSPEDKILASASASA